MSFELQSTSPTRAESSASSRTTIGPRGCWCGAEVLLLCTDGVHDALDACRLQQLLIEDLEPARIAANIVRAALLRGSHDNCTAVVGRYVPD